MMTFIVENIWLLDVKLEYWMLLYHKYKNINLCLFVVVQSENVGQVHSEEENQGPYSQNSQMPCSQLL